MKTYPKYKNSGVEWIGDIPKNWEVKKLKFVSKITRGAILRPVDEPLYFDENGEWTYLNISDATVCDKYLYEGKLKLSELGSTKSARVEPNNLIITASATIGKPFINKIPVCIHDGFIPITDLKIDLDFLYYYFKNPTLFNGLGKSNTQKNIYLEDVKNLDIPVPSLPEQIQIGKYIGYKMNQIETLIANKQKLIGLLQEERTAIINQAVTKGINPKAKIKPSGVEWLGEVPEHWEVKKIKYLGKIVSGYSFKSEDFIENNGCRVMKISNIQTMSIDWRDESFVPHSFYDSYPNFQIRKGDLVFALTRPVISTGIKAAIVDSDDKILLNQRNAVLKPKDLLNVNWMYFIIFNPRFVNYFESLIDNTGQQPNISSTDIANIPIPLPSKKEQDEIINFILIEQTRINTIIAKIEQEIELMKEYKTALISEVVTGKVDVRDEVIG